MNNKRRRLFAGLALLAAAIASLAAMSPAAAADKVRLSLADTSDPAYLPFFVAIDKGYYRDLGLDVSVVYVAGGVATPALLSGSLEFSTSTGSAITAILKGAPIKIVMNLSERVPWKLWATKADIKTLADLKGKSVGIQSHGDLFEMSMRTVLADAGIDSDAVRYTQLGYGSSARIAAIEHAMLPAVMLTNLEERIVRERGVLGKAHVLVDLSRAIRAPNNGLAASDTLIAANPGLVERMLRGTLMAVQFIKSRREEALRILQNHAPKLAPGVLSGALDETAATYLEDGMVSEAARKRQLAVRGEILEMPKDKIPAIDAVFDYSLVKQASERLQAAHWRPQ
ncbi:MAG: ABC transporter substrate-binding protein [Pseudolabrys sp.]|nr:ABC transporter substrate-binding protein [Pseudolabrys sp.]